VRPPLTIAAHLNENPLGPPPAAVRRLVEASGQVHRYPDGAVEAATAAVARHYGVPTDEVLVTRGVDEATDLLLLDHRGGWALEPGFDGYWERAAVLGLPFRRVPLDDDWSPALDPSELAGSGVGIVASPNNPSGRILPGTWIAEAIAVSSLVCIDETYLPFSSDPRSALDRASRDDRVCVFVSFSKLHGLAGLRLGALLGTPAVIASLRRRQRFHSVDVLALAAIEGCLEDVEHLDATRRHVLHWRPELAGMLRRADRLFDEVVDTEANFVVAHTTVDASTVRTALRERGLLTHDCANNGLPGWLRISIGTSDEMRAVPGVLDRAAELVPGRLR
jgi:histidinol-phosphate aminotransferase